MLMALQMYMQMGCSKNSYGQISQKHGNHFALQQQQLHDHDR